MQAKATSSASNPKAYTPPAPAASQANPEQTAKGPGTDKVIYGQDDRRDVYEVDKDWRARAKATLTLVRPEHLTEDGDRVQLKTQKYEVAPSERFADQETLGFCSAWWVGENIVITAGHCISPGEEKQVKMVAGYEIADPAQGFPKELPKDNVYDVKRVAYSVIDRRTGEDWAIVLLDRTFKGPKPFQLGTGELAQGTPVAAIGYPAGLPTKVTAGAEVKGPGGPGYFTADLDTYGGNSGSVIIDVESGLASGILVRGSRDYVWSREGMVSNVITDGSANEACTKVEAFKDELEEVRSGTLPAPKVAPDGTLDPASLRAALMPQIWRILRQTAESVGNEAPSMSTRFLSRREIAELPPLFRNAINEAFPASERFIPTAAAADAIGEVVLAGFDQMMHELTTNNVALNAGALGLIQDAGLQLVLTMGVVGVYGVEGLN